MSIDCISHNRNGDLVGMHRSPSVASSYSNIDSNYDVRSFASSALASRANSPHGSLRSGRFSPPILMVSDLSKCRISDELKEASSGDNNIYLPLPARTDKAARREKIYAIAESKEYQQALSVEDVRSLNVTELKRLNLLNFRPAQLKALTKQQVNGLPVEKLVSIKLSQLNNEAARGLIHRRL